MNTRNEAGHDGGQGAAAGALLERYTRELGASNPWARDHSTLLAGGAPHDSWRLQPFPPVFERAEGSHKWDVAGRRYLDLWMGHGALLLGNAHPAVVDAVARQMRRGQHVGGVHALHYAWAERIQRSMPSCERIRFTSSGTEATMLALRLARAWTGRGRVLRIDGHFHGWHDEALVHALPAERAGFNWGVADYVSLVPPLDVDAVEEELAANDVAALILEPGGGSAGSLPWSSAYLAALRKLADRHGTALIFDEVISGFRYGPGGVQALAGVRPDITVLAKIAAGGMPGGLVGGRAELMAVLGGGRAANGSDAHVPHSGTFNGLPLSAAAALATLDLVDDGQAARRAEQSAAQLVAGINAAAEAAGVDVRAFHQSSIFHLLIGAVGAALPLAAGPAAIRLPRERAPLYQLLRAALLLEGVDCHASHGWLAAAHDGADIAEALAGFARAFAAVARIDAFRVAGHG